MFTRKFVNVMMCASAVCAILLTSICACLLLPKLQTVEAVSCVTLVHTPAGGTDWHFTPRDWELHIVQEGETLWNLVAASLGEARDYVDIREAIQEVLLFNNKTDSGLWEGEAIYLPR